MTKDLNIDRKTKLTVLCVYVHLYPVCALYIQPLHLSPVADVSATPCCDLCTLMLYLFTTWSLLYVSYIFVCMQVQLGSALSPGLWRSFDSWWIQRRFVIWLHQSGEHYGAQQDRYRYTLTLTPHFTHIRLTQLESSMFILTSGGEMEGCSCFSVPVALFIQNF